MKKYYILTRRSVEETNRPGASHDYQTRAIQTSFKTREWVCMGIVSENLSGWKKVERTKLEDLYKRCKKEEVDYILVQVWDRFFRNVQLAFDWIERFKKIGVEVNAVEQWIHYDAQAVNTMLGIYLGMAADESHKISQRVSRSMYEWTAKGYWLKHAPYGYKKSLTLDYNKKKICVFDEEKAPIVERIFKMLAYDNYSIALARKTLEKDGIKIPKSTFYQLVSNVFYAGYIELPPFKNFPAKRIIGLHKGIVSLELFDKAQVNLEGHKSKVNKVYIKEKKKFDYPLKGVLRCNKCGRALYGNSPTSRSGKPIPYYDHTKCKVRFQRKLAHNIVVRALKDFDMNEETYIELKKKVKKQVNLKVRHLRVEKNKIEESLRSIPPRQKKLNLLLLDGMVNKSEYNELKETLNSTKLEHDAKLGKINAQLESVEFKLESVVDTVKQLKNLYSIGTVIQKRQILLALFPEGFTIEKEEKKYFLRTNRLNAAVDLMFSKSKSYRWIEIKKEDITSSSSSLVISAGLEPATS